MILKFAAAALFGTMLLSQPASAIPQISNGTCGSVFGATELGGTTSGVYGCSKFDSDLGPLLSISLTLTGNIVGTISLTNNGATGPVFKGTTTTEFYLASALSGFGFAVFPSGPLFSASYNTGNQIQAGGSTTVYGAFNANGSLNAVNSSGGTFGAYQNSGGVGNFLISMSTITGLTCTTGGGNGACGQITDAGAGASVVYTYDDGTVTTPEPATMALLGAGMLGLGLARRRRAA